MPANPATAYEIRQALGPLDDDMLMAILGTGATLNEIVQAYAWLQENDVIGGDLEKPMTANVRKVFDILQEDRELWDEERRA